MVSTSYALRENPKEALLCMGAAVHLVDASFHAKIISVVVVLCFFTHCTLILDVFFRLSARAMEATRAAAV